MANIAALLKEEIARQARKEVRKETEALKKASARYRTEIAGLKRRIVQLEQQLGRAARGAAKATAARSEATEAPAGRFSAKGLKSHRQRLDLSAAQVGKLLGVSTQTIYNWEAGETRPRDGQMAAVVALRKMGKREALAKLKTDADGE